jgi:type VI secretion system secreted protein Hcp
MAYDAFLHIDEVPGESTAKGYEGKTELMSFAWGANNPSTIGSSTGGAGSGKVSVSSFVIRKRSDSASPLLFQACCRGDHYPTAVVTLRKAGGTGGQMPFIVYKFTTVYVDGIQWSGASGGDDTPTETVHLSFGKVEVQYQPQAKTGAAAPKPIVAQWDLTTVSDK